MNGKTIVTIGREFGSGGRVIGEKLAEKLGVRCYDKELLTLAAKESGMCKELFETHDEKPTNSFLYSLVMDTYSLGYTTSSFVDMPINHKVFLAQFDTIKNLASRESCVIVGRCADVILRHRPHTIRLFIHAPEGFRRQRAETTYGLTEGEAAEKVRTINEERARHYKKYTGGSWGSAENYHLSVDSSLCGVEDCAKLLVDFVQKVEKNTL